MKLLDFVLVLEGADTNALRLGLQSWPAHSESPSMLASRVPVDLEEHLGKLVAWQIVEGIDKFKLHPFEAPVQARLLDACLALLYLASGHPHCYPNMGTVLSNMLDTANIPAIREILRLAKELRYTSPVTPQNCRELLLVLV